MKNKTTVITASDVKTLIATIPKGSYFTVRFITEKGTLRVMNGRTGVTAKLAKEPKRAATPCPEHLVRMFDVQINDYRSFKVNTVLSITACGQKFEVK